MRRTDEPARAGLATPRAFADIRTLRARLRLFLRVSVSSLGMLVRKLAMFFGGRCMVLGLIVLAARVVMLGLMVVMRRRMVWPAAV